MRGLAVGESVRLSVFRDGNRREVVYTLPERPILPSDVPDGRTVLSSAGRGRRARSLTTVQRTTVCLTAPSRRI